jgi:glycosyltransferase involved in cell wall biosynthesis
LPHRVAIVVAHFNQPGYLSESVASAVATGAHVVVVDDASTPDARLQAQDACRPHGPDVVLLQRPRNGGLSAARNSGIDWVRRHLPHVEWILPLDSDDVLEASSIERLIAAWDPHDPHLGWLYGDASLFGTIEVKSRVPRRFTRTRLLKGNFCFSTSFLHRRLFDDGVRYAEELRRGLEDWDLYLQAVERGWHGRHAGDFGFHYRKHGTSMLEETNLRLMEVEEQVRRRHPALYDHEKVLQWEHEEFPRFAVLDLDSAELQMMSSPDRPPATFRLAEGPLPDRRFLPPIVIAARGSWWRAVRDTRAMHQVLATVQAALAHQSSMVLGWHERPSGIAGLDQRSSDHVIAGLAFDATRAWTNPSAIVELLEGRGSAGEQMQYGPIVRERPQPTPLAHRSAVTQALAALLSEEHRDFVAAPGDHVYPLEREYVIEQTVVTPGRLELRVPDDSICDIGIVVPWAGLGGMDLIMLELAAAYAARPRTRVHLMTSEGGAFEIADRYRDVFTTINPVVSSSHNERTVQAFMEEMDILLVANSPKVYAHLALVRRRTSPAVFVFIQNVDLAADGASVGYLFPLARQFDAHIDGYVVPSELSASMIESFGVDKRKVHVVPNAAVYRPSKPVVIDAPDGPLGRPLHVLYAGRFDRQKGMDRLISIFDGLRSAGVPFEARLVGKAVLEQGDDYDHPDIRVVPPSYDVEVMREHFGWADVLVLPSRWEGLPLVMLDAMVFGVAVVTTDVGGIPEYVSDRVHAVVVSDQAGDAHVVGRFIDTLREMHASPASFVPMRQQAAAFSESLTWPQIAEDVARHFPRSQP